MADPVLKFPAEQKPSPPLQPDQAAASKPARGFFRKYRRLLLLVVLPLAALVAGVVFYLNGGRYVTTDDAYVGAQKVLITPDISGNIEKVVVREGQQVREGDTLFEIDPVPFRLALQQAQANLATAKTNYESLKSNLQIYGQMIELAQQGVDLKRRDVERKTSLVRNNVGTQLELDNANTALVTASAQQQYLKQQMSTAKNQLLGDADLPLEQFPPYAQAKAALDQAQRNLDHTTVRAPINGTATQVESIQLGRFIAAGTPVFSVIDTSKPWVDANPKESDFTYVAVGQKVTVEVDAFPDHVFKAAVGSLSPGTGAQFSILPPQNATGNFVKVVQRVPIRIIFDQDDRMVEKLKAGMSAYVAIDTNHRRSLATLLGLSPAVAKQD